MQSKEIEKSKSHILIEIIAYAPNSVVRKTIIRKTTGNISVVAIDTGEALAEKIYTSDTFIQLLKEWSKLLLMISQTYFKWGKVLLFRHTHRILLKQTGGLK